MQGSPLGGTLGLGNAWTCVLVPGAGTLLWMMFMNPGDQSFWGAFLSIATLSPYLESQMRLIGSGAYTFLLTSA